VAKYSQQPSNISDNQPARRSPLDWLGALSPSTMLGTLSRFDKLKVLSQSMGLSKRFEKRSRVPISGRAIRSPEPVEWGEGWLKLRSALFAFICG
jgi:hypothetical protein